MALGYVGFGMVALASGGQQKLHLNWKKAAKQGPARPDIPVVRPRGSGWQT
jgi:hypothetical protein